MMAKEEIIKASTNNMPAVDMFIVMEYIKHDKRLNSAILFFMPMNLTSATAFLK